MKEIQYCLFTRHAEDVNFIKKKRDVRPKKILHFFWNSQQKGFNMKPNENVQSAKYQNGVF